MRNVLNELDGHYDEYKSYTREELLQLIRRINDERKDAKYTDVYKIQYNEKYNGKRLLDGKHFAVQFYYEGKELKTGNRVLVDDQDILLKIREDGCLVVQKNGEEEVIDKTQLKYTEIPLPYVSMQSHTCLGGYTLKAIREILKIREKAKGEINE